jgi:GNAT superfamily N-acetyltransferase
MITLETWATGYCRARGYVDPTPGPAGLWMQIDLPEQVGRHVLTSAFDPEAYRHLVAGIAEPFVYVEALAPREALLPLAPDGWTFRDTHWLMTRRLNVESAEPPPGYTVRLVETDHKLQIDIEAPDGSPAATGRCGLADNTATFDRIVTEEAHRRRGLGSVVMARLAAAALARGVERGALIATPDGRALYHILGWTEVGEVTSVISG